MLQAAPDISSGRCVQEAPGITDDQRHLLALSDERDQWERRVDQAWRDGYDACHAGHDADRADACIALAEIEHHRESRQLWNEFAAKVQRIIASNDHPDMRIRQVQAEIAADQQLVADAKQKKPGALSPLEHAVLNRIRFERLDESEAA